jgi:hypothetical protein
MATSSVMDVIRIIFLDKQGNRAGALDFQIYNTTLAQRWLATIRENQLDPNKTIHSVFINKTVDDLLEIHNEMNEKIEIINQLYHTLIPVYNTDTALTHDQLNELHHHYEEYGDYIKFMPVGIDSTRLIHDSFLRLNELIHIYEYAVESGKEFPNMNMLFDYWPQTIFKPIQERDKHFLRINHKWGQLYLGYNTLGKDWSATYADNDIDLVKRQSVRPQRRFAAEAWMNFSKHDDEYTNSMVFEQWYDNLDDETKNLVPYDDLNELTMGKFLIGEVVINKWLLSFEPDINQWLLPDSKTKADWNKKVFSKFQGIESIEVLQWK